jgi:hypothetical protein
MSTTPHYTKEDMIPGANSPRARTLKLLTLIALVLLVVGCQSFPQNDQRDEIVPSSSPDVVQDLSPAAEQALTEQFGEDLALILVLRSGMPTVLARASDTTVRKIRISPTSKIENVDIIGLEDFAIVQINHRKCHNVETSGGDTIEVCKAHTH